MTTHEHAVEERVIQIVAKIFHRDITQINKDTQFIDDLFAKSLNIIELTAVLENEFDIDIPAHEARRNKTVGQAIALIERLLQK